MIAPLLETYCALSIAATLGFLALGRARARRDSL